MKTEKFWLLLIGVFFSLFCSQAAAQSAVANPSVSDAETAAEQMAQAEAVQPTPSPGSEFAFEDGKDYFSYTIPIKANPLDHRIEVRLFFTYECAHCLTAFDNLSLYQRLHDEQVRLMLQPIATEEALFGPNVYYSLRNLDRQGLAELLLFDSAERQGRKSLVAGENLYHWLISHNVALDQFLMQLNSQAVAAKAKEAVELTEKYGVFTSPFVVIDGQYVLTSSTLYNDDYTFAVMDFLVSRILQQRQSNMTFTAESKKTTNQP
ncbi:thiol:disulfide interchange protein [Testudinibacter sp. P80/BLE/0925]|uniref:thiol:disulfide interchange protein n=1 Tax=Testudinibacter sp. TW-1 TaxID=3417757 RepID=UPI003D35AD52